MVLLLPYKTLGQSGYKLPSRQRGSVDIVLNSQPTNNGILNDLDLRDQVGLWWYCLKI